MKPPRFGLVDHREQGFAVNGTSTMPAIGLEKPPATAGVFAACQYLLGVTLWRQMFSRQMLVNLVLTALVAAIVSAWTLGHRSPSPERLSKDIFTPILLGFLVPIFAISHGASGIGGEREDRSLIYLLITPIPRPLVFLTKALSTTLLVAAWSAAAVILCCLLAKSPGYSLLPVYFPALLVGGAVYGMLFLTIGALFRHGTIISLAYWFFLEVLFGEMPGMVKRITVRYYLRCWIYDFGSWLHLGPSEPLFQQLLLPVSGTIAILALLAMYCGLAAVGSLVFTSREYTELG